MRRATEGHIFQHNLASADSGLVLYADGAAVPNPGPGGWGFVVYRAGREIHSACGGSEVTTNNIMEMTGVLRALEWVAAQPSTETITVFSDSQYVVKGCNIWRHGWKGRGWRRGKPNAACRNRTIANVNLWKELDAVLTDRPVTLEWVKGHAGILGNERADQLANQGMRNKGRTTTSDLIIQQLGEYVY